MKFISIIILSLTMILAGCASDGKNNKTYAGAGIGGVVGAGVGAVLGKKKGAVIGAVMQAMQGKADAARVRELVLERAAALSAKNSGQMLRQLTSKDLRRTQ